LLLEPEAQTVLGKVHPQTAPALHLLEQEGFRYQGYIDIFDGGPTVEAPLADIRSVRRSREVTVKIGDSKGGGTHLVSNTELAGFRCALAELTPDQDSVELDAELAAALDVKAGSSVRVAAL